MRAFLECVGCIVRQTGEVAQMAGAAPDLQWKALQIALKILSTRDPRERTAPELTASVHQELQKLFGTNDLYAVVKQKENALAARLVPEVQALVDSAEDSLEMAVRVSILGNVIDYGALVRFNFEDLLAKIRELKFGRYDYSEFQADIAKKPTILYVGDNTGEIFFDKILVEELLKRGAVVTYAVKNVPTLNDVTMDDAELAGLTKIVPVIRSGSTTPGTLMTEASPEFVAAIETADFLIAKGQGNLETLDTLNKPVYFLAKMKCPYLAEALGFALGDLVLWGKG